MYPYSRTEGLSSLHAEGESNLLIFKTPTEIARVQLSDDHDIVSVEHEDLVNGTNSTIKSADAKHIVVGESNWQRDVYHYLVPNPHAHLQMRLGITVHRGEGTWSSLPHDFEMSPEPDFEEVFFYLLKGGPMRAIQVGRGVWMDNSSVDDLWPVRDRTFGVVPMGYHPVVGEPGVSVRYVWAYLVKHKHWEKI